MAHIAQATASSSATEADRRLAEVYAEAQAAVQQVQVDSNQQNALLKQELETSKNNYALQGAKLKSHISELAEQRLFSEKLSGEIKQEAKPKTSPADKLLSMVFRFNFDVRPIHVRDLSDSISITFRFNFKTIQLQLRDNFDDVPLLWTLR